VRLLTQLRTPTPNKSLGLGGIGGWLAWEADQSACVICLSHRDTTSSLDLRKSPLRVAHELFFILSPSGRPSGQISLPGPVITPCSRRDEKGHSFGSFSSILGSSYIPLNWVGTFP